MSPYPEKTTLKHESTREQQGRLVSKGSHFRQFKSELKKTLSYSNRICNEHTEVKMQYMRHINQFRFIGISLE
jgi:hypothetical protein